MKKKLLTLILALVMIVTAAMPAFAHNTLAARYEPCGNCGTGFLSQSTMKDGEDIPTGATRSCTHSRPNRTDSEMRTRYATKYTCTSCGWWAAGAPYSYSISWKCNG